MYQGVLLAVNFFQEVKIATFVNNATNAESTPAMNIRGNSLCVIIVFDLVKIEFFTDYLDIVWIIEAYFDIIALFKKFFCVGVCLFVFLLFFWFFLLILSSWKYYIKLLIRFFLDFLCFFKHFNFVSDWVIQ